MSEICHANSLITQCEFFDVPLIVYDTETTGLSAMNDRIIQLAGKVLNPKNLEVEEEFNFFINPGYILPDKIVKLTGITDAFLKDKPKESEVFNEIFAIFGESPNVIGHNVPFDNGFMSELYIRHGKIFTPDSIDTCQMAREALRKGIDVPNHKLSTVANFFDIEVDFHKADADVEATYWILRKMIN